MTRKFDLSRALTNWQYRYQSEDELRDILRRELQTCHGTVRGRNGQMVAREYPQTERNLTLMLLALEDG